MVLYRKYTGRCDKLLKLIMALLPMASGLVVGDDPDAVGRARGAVVLDPTAARPADDVV